MARQATEARQAGARLGAALGAGRLHLAALDAAIAGASCGLACGLVPGEGMQRPVLKVSREDQSGYWVDVGAARVGDRWWYVLEPGGEGVTPVDDVVDAPAVLVGILGREGGR